VNVLTGCIQSELNQAEAETLAAKERAKKQLEEARRLTNLKESDTELPKQLQNVCCIVLLLWLDSWSLTQNTFS